MIRKMLNVCKLGLPKVNLVLEETETNPGGKIYGSIHVQGGWMKHETTRLECDLIRKKPGGDSQFIAPARTILMSHTVGKNEKREIPFRYQLPAELSTSTDNMTYQLRTKLVFKDDSKCTDHDDIIVRS